MSDLLLKEIDFTQFLPPGNNVVGVSIRYLWRNPAVQHFMPSSVWPFCKWNLQPQSNIYFSCWEFFSDLTAVEFTTTGCPKAVQIPNLIGQVTLMNKHKHDPEKFFFMELTSKSVYLCNVMDLTEDIDPLEDTDGVAYITNHLFDKQVIRSTQRKEGKKFKINEPDKTARGTHGVQ